MRRFSFLLGMVVWCAAVTAWGMPPHKKSQKLPKIIKARAVIAGASGSKVEGEVRFEQVGNEVTMTADLHHLHKGVHGFHIHEHGDCSAPDASSCGGHFNPTNEPHGAPGSGPHHVGDLGNITADKKGNAQLTFTTKGLTLRHGKLSLIGRSVIIHEKVDDFTSQPAGNAGKRIGCGVIQLVE